MGKAKEALLWCVLVALCAQMLNAEPRQPTVQVYTRYPVEVGKENILQCYVDGFHPPKISITLLKNKEPIESQESDLSFHTTWDFFKLAHANVTIDGKSEFACRVEHETFSKPKTVLLDQF